ncbi:MAG: hypothetical protein GY703_23245 [Gammaproteobacteria bacterium]|nr:hypothetical protein [Gammaproteobacteria bacterium]
MPKAVASGTSTISGIRLSTATPDARIRYATDGSTPGLDSPIYTGPLDFLYGVTVRACAVKEGAQPSEISWARYQNPTTDNSVAVSHVDDNESCAEPEVSLTLTPDEKTRSYALQEMLPLGLDPANLDSDGIWNPDTRTIKWGPFSDNLPRTFTYSVASNLGVNGAYSYWLKGSPRGEAVNRM